MPIFIFRSTKHEGAHANKDMQLKELYCALMIKGSSRCTPSRHGSRQPSERQTSPASMVGVHCSDLIDANAAGPTKG